MDPLTIGLIMGGSSLVGGLFGGNAAEAQQDAINRGVRTLRGMDFGGQTGELNKIAQGGYSPYLDNGGEDYNAWQNQIKGFDPSQFAYADPAAFNYDLQAKTKEFLDPSMNYQIQQATQAVEGSAANAGKLFSGATGKAIADRSQDIAQQSWKDALATALGDRNFQYGMYGDDISRGRQAQDQALNLWNTQTSGLGNLAKTGMDANLGLMNTNLGNLQTQFTNENNRDIAVANLQGQSGPGFWGGFGQGAMQGAGMAGDIMGNYFGAKAG